ncbi:restriction endonuclease [Lysobacter sp. SG-8]|uniref:Restriction endonuclease n=1 Tax=Marilutibacter penaei TaxID=2759900 RepID=A0A7W3U5S7_9GAMM|nr:HNH endonuclease [Lysobacter penaei]MBB1089468.1 restriction endonuclease [Lysobacter penaei]
MKTSIKNRERAFVAQDGRCYYCKCAMWRGHGRKDFCQRHSLTQKQALALRSTAEHLTARCDGGGDAASNIVAACLRCNGGRHQRKGALNPNAFEGFVERRVALGKWHGFDVRRHKLRPV